MVHFLNIALCGNVSLTILADYQVLVTFQAILLLQPERNTLVKKGQKGKGEYSQLRLNAEDFNGQLVLAITTWGAVHSYHTHLTNNYFLQKVNFLLRRFLAPRLLSHSTFVSQLSKPFP